MNQMSNREYHARKDACSSSWLKRAVQKSALHADMPFKATAAMKLGTIVHTLVLEPEEKSAIIMPDINTASKKGWAEFGEWVHEREPENDPVYTEYRVTKKSDVLEHLERVTGLPVVSQDVASKAIAMRDAVMAHPEAAKLLKGGQPEFTVFAEIDGFECKARVDYRRDDIHTNIELKTCADASPDGFRRQFENMMYDLSVAWYERVLAEAGHHTEETIVIAVENTEPYGVRVMSVSEDLKMRGWELAEIGFKMWKEKQFLGESAGYPTGIDDLEPSPWAWNVVKALKGEM